MLMVSFALQLLFSYLTHSSSADEVHDKIDIHPSSLSLLIFTFLISFSSPSSSHPSSIFRPVSAFEFDKFARGSRHVLEAIVAATAKGSISIISTASVTIYTCFNRIPSLFLNFFSVVCLPSFLLFCRRWYSDLCWEVWNGWLGVVHDILPAFYFYSSVVTCIQIILYVLLVIMWCR